MDEPDQATRIIIAQLDGTVMRHASWDAPTPAEVAVAVAELHEIIAGRPDGPELLAHVAGIVTGACAIPELMPRAVNAAAFCVAAGADEALIPGWESVGSERLAEAELPPFGSKVLGPN
jgi:hypothetical protein